MKSIFNYTSILGFSTWLLVACGRSPESAGTEYAPQMYISKSYEPYSQAVKDDGKTDYNTLNPMGLNMRTPPENTVARRRFNTIFETKDSTGTAKKMDLMIYNIHRDSIMIAERILKNPYQATPEILEQGQVLYLRYCAPCHGEKGDGKGKVAAQYKGVPVYSSAALKNLNGGHIFHVITHGKGRMWPHASQLNVDERWKVVHYVHTLQNPDGAKSAEGTEAKADSIATSK
jgi:mono/diheme cytochrome c family protein